MDQKKPTTRKVQAKTRDGGAAVRRSNCPVGCALDILGDRWTLLVIRDLMAGKKRYGEFLASAERIPTNILADRLKRLEREGLVSSTRYSEHARRFEYHLTDQGKALRPAISALAGWGMRHFPGTLPILPRYIDDEDQAPASHPD